MVKTDCYEQERFIEPDNEQGRFEKALRMLQEKLKDFHCPICHAEEGITLYDEPYFVMHYDWDKNTDKPWKILLLVLEGHLYLECATTAVTQCCSMCVNLQVVTTCLP